MIDTATLHRAGCGVRYAAQRERILAAVQAAGPAGLTQTAMFHQLGDVPFGDYENPESNNFGRWITLAMRMAKVGLLVMRDYPPTAVFLIP